MNVMRQMAEVKASENQNVSPSCFVVIKHLQMSEFMTHLKSANTIYVHCNKNIMAFENCSSRGVVISIGSNILGIDRLKP